MIVKLDGLTNEIIGFYIWHYLGQVLALNVFPYVKQEVSTVLVQFVLSHLITVQVVVSVPLAIKGILGEAHVVAKAKGAVMVHYAMQVVACLNL